MATKIVMSQPSEFKYSARKSKRLSEAKGVRETNAFKMRMELLIATELYEDIFERLEQGKKVSTKEINKEINKYNALIKRLKKQYL